MMQKIFFFARQAIYIIPNDFKQYEISFCNGHEFSTKNALKFVVKFTVRKIHLKQSHYKVNETFPQMILIRIKSA